MNEKDLRVEKLEDAPTDNEIYSKLFSSEGNSVTEYVSKYFETLISRSSEVGEETLTTLEVNGIILGNGAFCVILFSIDENSIGSIKDATRFDYYQKLHQLAAKVLKISCVHYFLDIGGRLLCLTCFPRIVDGEDSRVERMRHMLFSACGQIVDAFERSTGKAVDYAISNVFYGVRNISSAYDSALDLLKYTMFCEIKCSSLPQDINGDDTSYGFEFPLFNKSAEKLTEAIINGDRKRVFDNFDLWFEYLVKSPPHSMIITTLRILSFFNLFFSKIYSMSTLEHSYLEKCKIFSSLTYALTKTELRRISERLFDELLYIFEARRKNLDSENMVEIRQYIDSNIDNVNLSVSKIADEVGLTQPSLSRKFKSYYGQSPKDYVHLCRIKRAKELLADTDKTLTEIADETGYGSLSTLHRAFLKYEGITPGNYRLDSSK